MEDQSIHTYIYIYIYTHSIVKFLLIVHLKLHTYSGVLTCITFDKSKTWIAYERRGGGMQGVK